MTEDKRPDPKPRKHVLLWQNYLWWNELVEMRKKHLLRISSIERGKSNLDANFEQDTMEWLGLDNAICQVTKSMIACGHTVGPVWDWLTSIRGLAAGSLAARLVAQIDDIAKFDTISKLWRFSGWAVLDGKVESRDSQHYNRRLKSTCWLIIDQFIKQNTPYYRELYDDYKAKQRETHPIPVCRECGEIDIKKRKSGDNYRWVCTDCKSTKIDYTDMHLHNRAIRYVAKRLLAHLWLVWRESDGLPISGPWIQEHGGHTHIEPPPNWAGIKEKADG